MLIFFFSGRSRHTRWTGDWSSDVCSSDLAHGRVDDLVGGPLGGQDDDDACGAASGDQVAAQGGEFGLLFLVADGGGEVGVLIDHHQVDRLAGVAGDLAAASGEQPVVAGVHDLLEFDERGDGVFDG